MVASVLALDNVPEGTDLHSWADWLELLCLANKDGLVSKADVLDRWVERDAVDPEPEGEDEVPEDFDEAADNLDRVIDAPLGSNRDHHRHEKQVQRIDDAFRHIRYRVATFGAAYPFQIRGTTLVRRPLSPTREFYAFLLFASGKQWLTRQADRTAVEKAVERLAAAAVRRWLPGEMEVHVFGTSRKKQDRYTGDLPARILAFAQDINESRLLGEEAYRDGNYGDGGLDVVAWRRPLDGAPGTLVVFAQATTERKWANKQGDASWDKWRQRLTFKCPPLSVLVIPFCFRTPVGAWYLESEVQTMVLDRVRLVALMRRDRSRASDLPAQFLQEALSYREAVA